MRRLGPDEAELWAKVAATIRPLSRDPIPTKADPSISDQINTAASSPPRVRGRVPPARPIAPPATLSPSLAKATLDGGWDRRLSSGRVDPDRTLDLHGHNLDRAWAAIDQALERAIASGERVLLLITGHEQRGEPPVERGRIRAAVHDWLTHSRHARHIAAVRGAHRRHGGGGSLYIILRRHQILTSSV